MAPLAWAQEVPSSNLGAPTNSCQPIDIICLSKFATLVSAIPWISPGSRPDFANYSIPMRRAAV
jgi:hypothetical protein